MDEESLVPQRVLFVLLWCGIVSVILLYMVWRDMPRLSYVRVPMPKPLDGTLELMAAAEREAKRPDLTVNRETFMRDDNKRPLARRKRKS